MTPQKALRDSIARAAQEMAELEITATGCTETAVSVAEIADGLDPALLLLLLEGPQRALGLAVIDPQIVAGVVEHLTTGRVVPSAAAARSPTRTDAMMISDLINQMLGILDAELAQMPDAPPLSGFRQKVALEDARAVTMALEEIPFRQFRLTLDLGRGAKTGEITFFLPQNPPRKTDFRTREYHEWQKAWRDQVMRFHTEVEAVIHRVSMPVTEVSALKVGALIPVPVANVRAVSLEGSDCRSLATGKLGQTAGYRAIRITSDIHAIPLPVGGAMAAPVARPAKKLLQAAGDPVHNIDGQARPEAELSVDTIGDTGDRNVAVPD